MKYTYNGKNKKEIIRNYKIVNNEIIVNLLNNSYYNMPNDLSGEQEVISKMVNQAEERNNSNHRRKVINSCKYHSKQALIIIPPIVFGMVLKINDPDTLLKILSTIIITTGSLVLAICIINVIINLSELKDIKKYDLYLSMKDIIEEYKNSNNNVLNDEFKNLDINTIDNYSLKDIKRLRKTLVNEGRI